MGTFWAAATLKTSILSWLFRAPVCFFFLVDVCVELSNSGLCVYEREAESECV